MKESLEEHIKNIFSSCDINVPFTIFDCVNMRNNIPEWLSSIQLTHEYIAYCSKNIDVQKLQTFSGKIVNELESYVYWFEGERITNIEDDILSSLHESQLTIESKIEYLKTATSLPHWLDEYIYKELEAKYSPDFVKFEYNLNLNLDESLIYLGTYFPRSYGESFCIFDNIFQNNVYHTILLQKKEIYILTVGCGSGGDVIGLITNIYKYHPHISHINIWAIDGNDKALAIFDKISEKLALTYNVVIKSHLINQAFETINSIDIKEIIGIKFDYITSFKLICEIISKGKGKLDNSYYDFILKFLPLLSENGLCTLLDVTTRSDHADYNPILKNQQVNKALKKLQGKFKTLLPLSCSQNERHCKQRCFTQRVFYISHSRVKNDLSKVSYRVIGYKKMVDSIIDNNETAKYILQKNENNNIKSFCPCSDNLTIVDGYKLN